PVFRGLAIAGLCSVPLSWILLEGQKWAMIPQWQPARAVLFISLIAALFSAAAGFRARTTLESAAWFALAFAIPMHHAIVSRTFRPAPIALAAALAVTAAFLRRYPAIVLVPLAAFIAMPRIVRNYSPPPPA